jgi:PAS domain S-box-containing protein
VLLGLVALCGVIALVDLAVSRNAVLIGFLATGPLIGAALARPRTTALVGVWAVALALALGPADGMFGSTDHLIRVTVVATLSVLAVWIAEVRSRLDRARERYRLIADAGATLSRALDAEVMLIDLARLCVHRLCDWCFVFVCEPDGAINQVAAAHRDPERQRLAWDLLVRYPLDRDRPEGPAKAIRTGEPELLPSVGDELLRAIAADDENLQLLQRLGLRSAMITPLVARGRTLGAIAFASAESGRVYAGDDLALAVELSGRAAMAVDNARLYARAGEAEREARTSHYQLQAILGGVADAVTAQDASGRLVYANDAAARLVGLSSAQELLEANPAEMPARYELIGPDGDPFPFDDLPGRRALSGEDPEPALLRYRIRATGEERWSLVKATAIRDDQGRPVLAINVVEEVTEQRRREESHRLLADASRALAASLDVDETFPRVAQLAAERLGDWCAIAEVEPDGTVRTIAVGDARRADQPLVAEMLQRYPLATPGRTYLAGPLSEGRPELVAEVGDAELAAAARDDEHLALLRQVRPRSAMTVPMHVRGRLVGAVSILTATEGRRLGDDDLELAQELAGRCALALESGRLYAERSRIARTLQESLLPPMLPELPGLDVAARFRAAGAGIEVGGDFYDLFDVGDGNWAVAIGDVCGKGTDAAAVTALARYTVRAAAMRQDDPSEILTVLNEALLRQRGERRFCTVLFGRLARNGAGTAFEFASGGHPLPLVLDGDGSGHEVGAPGTLLGIVADPSLDDAEVTLRPGDAVVLYTDGVTDAAAPARVWTPEELAEAVGSVHGLDADAIADRILQSALESTTGEPRDDIAIIVVKVPDAVAA